MTLKNASAFCVLLISVVVALIYGQKFLIPFIFALLLWFVIRDLRSILDRNQFVRTKIPSWIKSLVAAVFVVYVLSFVSRILIKSITTLAVSYRKYEVNIGRIISKINDTFNTDVIEIVTEYIGNFDFGIVFGAVLNSITDVFGNAFIILIYTLFIFLEERYFQNKLRAVFVHTTQFARISNILETIESSISHYLGLKTLVSFITAFCSFVVLSFIGIDSPVVWAFLIFLLNYIPTIGSIVATLFPAAFCILQFGSFMPSIFVLIFVGGLQVLIGNIIEPRLMGNSFNISPLVAILSLSFWGYLWGVIGMILSIPTTVIMVILLSQFPRTRPIAVMLSGKGELAT